MSAHDMMKLADELKQAIDQVPGINQQNLIVRAEKALRSAGRPVKEAVATFPLPWCFDEGEGAGPDQKESLPCIADANGRIIMQIYLDDPYETPMVNEKISAMREVVSAINGGTAHPTPSHGPVSVGEPDYDAAARALGFRQLENGKWHSDQPLSWAHFVKRWDSAAAIFDGFWAAAGGALARSADSREVLTQHQLADLLANAIFSENLHEMPSQREDYGPSWAQADMLDAAKEILSAGYEVRKRVLSPVRGGVGDEGLWSCTGCGSRKSIEQIRAEGGLSCCPERKMAPPTDGKATHNQTEAGISSAQRDSEAK